MALPFSGLVVTVLLPLQTPVPSATPPLIPPGKPGECSRDGRDGQPVLLGVCTREQVLAHREVYLEGTRKTEHTLEWKGRWRAISAPCTLVVAFGSWCGDSQRELPDLLAHLDEPNPFITVRFIGVWRDKQAQASWWPRGVDPQKVEKVPTLWAFTLQPGGGQALAGVIVENPPVKGQRMAEAILELLERAAR